MFVNGMKLDKKIFEVMGVKNDKPINSKDKPLGLAKKEEGKSGGQPEVKESKNLEKGKGYSSVKDAVTLSKQEIKESKQEEIHSSKDQNVDKGQGVKEKLDSVFDKINDKIADKFDKVQDILDRIKDKIKKDPKDPVAPTVPEEPVTPEEPVVVPPTVPGGDVGDDIGPVPVEPEPPVVEPIENQEKMSPELTRAYNRSMILMTLKNQHRILNTNYSELYKTSKRANLLFATSALHANAFKSGMKIFGAENSFAARIKQAPIAGQEEKDDRVSVIMKDTVGEEREKTVSKDFKAKEMTSFFTAAEKEFEENIEKREISDYELVGLVQESEYNLKKTALEDARDSELKELKVSSSGVVEYEEAIADLEASRGVSAETSVQGQLASSGTIPTPKAGEDSGYYGKENYEVGKAAIEVKYAKDLKVYKEAEAAIVGKYDEQLAALGEEHRETMQALKEIAAEDGVVIDDDKMKNEAIKESIEKFALLGVEELTKKGKAVQKTLQDARDIAQEVKALADSDIQLIKENMAAMMKESQEMESAEFFIKAHQVKANEVMKFLVSDK